MITFSIYNNTGKFLFSFFLGAFSFFSFFFTPNINNQKTYNVEIYLEASAESFFPFCQLYSFGK